MGNVADGYRATDARKKGYYAGLYGEPNSNPYKAATQTWLAWDDGWRQGHEGSERMKRRQVRAI